ncbi:MOSC domain-containing protein [Maritimibacter dapengensis]|uniref:Sulfurase n=1 Tax=Maritimibacter dapengensis TaxID=2836868 RepID=A0ABS6T0L5_9RHOB|nr:sulfurase [Maritimibacter dapengensis]MBV7378288.1 sulfurase [Maritimibacter dapengensis]
MPDIYERTPHIGRITFLGRVTNRSAGPASEPLETARLTWEGIEGESHGGLTRRACIRVSTLHPEAVEIRNTRQLTILSAEEIAETARELGMDVLDPALMGASIVIEGIPDLTYLPPSARLQTAGGATMVVDGVNHPCVITGKSVEAAHPGKGVGYKPAAMHRRGVVAWAERPGELALGDEVTLTVPKQRAWAPLG